MFYERFANENGRPGHWRIEADVATICAVETVAEAVRRAEGLEGVRCVVRGLARDLSGDQLRDAEVTAREMMEAADNALTTAPGAEAKSCEVHDLFDQYQRLFAKNVRAGSRRSPSPRC